MFTYVSVSTSALLGCDGSSSSSDEKKMVPSWYMLLTWDAVSSNESLSVEVKDPFSQGRQKLTLHPEVLNINKLSRRKQAVHKYGMVFIDLFLGACFPYV